MLRHLTPPPARIRGWEGNIRLSHGVRATTEAHIVLCDKLFCSVLLSIRVPCHKCFHVAIIFEICGRWEDDNRSVTNSSDVVRAFGKHFDSSPLQHLN
jgi:hypothetical protein